MYRDLYVLIEPYFSQTLLVRFSETEIRKKKVVTNIPKILEKYVAQGSV